MAVKLHLEDVSWREIEGEIVMLHLHEGTYISLNRTASALWVALVEGSSRQQLVDTLVNRFEVDGEVATRDIDAFVDELRARRLVD